MTDAQKETYIAWLNDAHSLELNLVTMLEKQITETEGLPTMQAKLQEHLEKTKRHAELVEGCVVRNGGSVSAMKDFMSKTGAVLSGLGMSMMDDAMVKNVHASYAAEHMEIATYSLLRAAAEELGDTATVTICDEIMQDEEDMADWLIDQIDVVVKTHLAEKAAE